MDGCKALGVVTYLRSFLIFSISPGSLAAKVSLSDCDGRQRSSAVGGGRQRCMARATGGTDLGLGGRVAAEAVEGGGAQRSSGAESALAQTESGSHCG
jgi:hypothetical protein